MIEVRPATSDDLPGIADVALIADPPDEGDEVDLGYYEFLLGHGELLVAEGSGIVVGYAGSVPAGPLRHITDLFLHPDVRGRGIGTRLLRALPDEGPTVTFSSMHPSALPLYVRRGLVPRWPLLYLRGSAEPAPPPDLQMVPIQPARAARLESEWLGWDRRTLFDHWAQAPGTRLVALLESDDPVAVAAVGRRRARDTLLHLSCIDRTLTSSSVLAVLGACGPDVLVPLPAGSPALRPLLDRGLSLIEQDVFCASEDGLIDPERLIPHPGLL